MFYFLSVSFSLFVKCCQCFRPYQHCSQGFRPKISHVFVLVPIQSYDLSAIAVAKLRPNHCHDFFQGNFPRRGVTPNIIAYSYSLQYMLSFGM